MPNARMMRRWLRRAYYGAARKLRGIMKKATIAAYMKISA